MEDTNLYDETIEMIHYHDKTTDNVDWVGNAKGTFAISWDEFAEIAKGTNYDCGYGGQEVASDLVIVFNDKTWLERYEYDGSENWVYNCCPVKKVHATKFSTVIKEESIWKTLESMNY